MLMRGAPVSTRPSLYMPRLARPLLLPLKILAARAFNISTADEGSIYGCHTYRFHLNCILKWMGPFAYRRDYFDGRESLRFMLKSMMHDEK